MADDRLIVSEIFGPTLQGEGPSIGRRAGFLRLGRCNQACSWCFVAETPVLMGDWSWRELGAIHVGDVVMGLVHPEGRGRHNQMKPTQVRAVTSHFDRTVVVNSVVRCTPDHKFWLTGRNRDRAVAAHSGWREVERAVGLRALYVCDPAEKLDAAEYERGWLAGMADGDGCFWTLNNPNRKRLYRRFRLALQDATLLARFERHARDAGFELYNAMHNSGAGQSFKPANAVMPCLYLTRDEEARRFEAWLVAEPTTRAWAWGYLGGILDAEGSLPSQRQLRIAQDRSVYPAICNRIESVLVELGIGFTVNDAGFYLHARAGELSRILTNARPSKASFLRNSINRHPGASRVIETVEPGAEERVYCLTTDAGSFVAGGFVVKNCDTAFTWDWSRFDPATELHEKAVAEVASEVAAIGADLLVVSGGEPLLQQSGLSALLRQIPNEVEIETAGTIAPTPEVIERVARFNVSPKLANSGNPIERRLKPEVLRAFQATSKSAFKFVVTCSSDLDEVQAIVDDCGLTNVWVMPEGGDSSMSLAGMQVISDEVIARGWNLSPRLHVLLWGDTRGR